MKTVTISVGISNLIYTVLSMLAIYMFGSRLEADLLDNIGEDGYNWESTVLSISFLIMILCHIPFVFFYGKENFLVLIDEIDRKSISKAL